MIIRQCSTMLCNARSALMMAALLCVAVSSDTNGVLDDSLGNTTSRNNTTINGDSDINIGNNSSSNNTNDTTTTQNNGGPQNSPAFQFVAFLAWYIFLVLCCVIPACCAFRRRRYMDEERLRQQHANIQRLQQSNLFLWTQSQHAAMSSEAAVALRKTMLSDALASTSMVVEPDHLVKALALGLEEVVLNDGNDLGDDDGNKASEAAATVTVASALHPDTDNTAVRFPDLERGLEDPDPDDVESNRLLLQLPNGRTVGSMCAICLSQYEVGDNVTWSMHCPHAFHSDCIISWLSKKQHCPVCRQDFCNVLPISVQDTEEQQRQLSLAFGGTLPLSSLFSVEPSGRLVAISLGSNENNHYHYHHHSNSMASSRHNSGQYVGPRGRWTPPWQGTWTTNAESPAQASNINNARPVRVHLPSLSNPRMFIAETHHPELARSEEPSPSVPVDVASDVSSDPQSIPDNGGSPESFDESSR